MAKFDQKILVVGASLVAKFLRRKVMPEMTGLAVSTYAWLRE